MKTFLTLVLGLFAFGAHADDRVDFLGEFSSVASTAEPCDHIFAERAYLTQFRLVGANDRTLVTRFNHLEGRGFFNQGVFVTNYGYRRDFYWDRTWQRDWGLYHIQASGMVNRDVTVIDVEVDLWDRSGYWICQATARYSGFNAD